MRKIICYENALDFSNCFIVDGAAKWDDKLPIVWNFSNELNDVLGQAVDLRREEDGAITAELMFLDLSVNKLMSAGDTFVTIYANELDYESCDGIRVFHNLRIREISVLPAMNGVVPW